MYSLNLVSFELGSLIEITSGILSSRKRLDKRDRANVRLLLEAVRDLYADDPTIKSLRAFARGSELVEAEVALADLQLNVSDRGIYEALDLVGELARKDNVFISLDAIEHIKDARSGKTGLRFELSMFVSELWRMLELKDEVLIQAARRQGALIVEMIDILNAQLRMIDSSLREEGLQNG
jgi:hypothetical protein